MSRSWFPIYWEYFEGRFLSNSVGLRRLLPSFLTFITYVFLYYTLVVRAFVLPFRASFHTVQWSLCWVGRGLCDPSCPRAESKLLCISVFSFHILQSVFLFRGKKTFILFCISETSKIGESHLPGRHEVWILCIFYRGREAVRRGRSS